MAKAIDKKATQGGAKAASKSASGKGSTGKTTPAKKTAKAATGNKAASKATTKAPVSKGAAKATDTATASGGNNNVTSATGQEQSHALSRTITYDVKALQTKLPHIELGILGEIINKLEEMRVESTEIVNHHMRTDLKPREESSDVGDDLDQASTQRDREFNLIMHQRHLRRLQQIEDAFERLEDGVYGLCEGTDEPINPKRLRIMPLARYSLEYQEQQEKMLGRSPDGSYMGETTEELGVED